MNTLFANHIIKALAFDLDGTLVNSLQDLTNSANAMREKLHLAALPVLQIEHHIGDGISRLVHRAITNERDGKASSALFKHGFSEFMAHYSKHLTTHTCAYEGVIDGLSQLKSAHIPMVVITNKSAHFAIEILEALKLSHYFSLVIGGESLPEKKPHAMPLLHACEFLKILPSQLAMIGDSQNDALAARNAGAMAIGVTYGFEDISNSKPDLMISSLTELPALLFDHNYL